MIKNKKKNKRIKIKFDEKDRENFLKNQGKKHSKIERKKFNEKEKNEIKRKEKIERNKIIKEQIEKRYNEIQAMKKEINRYADLSSEESEEQ